MQIIKGNERDIIEKKWNKILSLMMIFLQAFGGLFENVHRKSKILKLNLWLLCWFWKWCEFHQNWQQEVWIFNVVSSSRRRFNWHPKGKQCFLKLKILKPSVEVEKSISCTTKQTFNEPQVYFSLLYQDTNLIFFERSTLLSFSSYFKCYWQQ